MTTHHLPHPLAESRQLPAIFFLSCRRVLLSCFIYLFSLTVSLKAVRWQSTDPTDRKSIQSHPSRRSLSSYLDILTWTWKYTGLSESRSRRGRTVSPFSFLFPEVYLSVGNPRKVHCDRSFFVKWSHGAVTVTERGSGRSHLIRQQSSPQTKTQYLQCSAT